MASNRIAEKERKTWSESMQVNVSRIERLVFLSKKRRFTIEVLCAAERNNSNYLNTFSGEKKSVWLPGKKAANASKKYYDKHTEPSQNPESNAGQEKNAPGNKNRKCNTTRNKNCADKINIWSWVCKAIWTAISANRKPNKIANARAHPRKREKEWKCELVRRVRRLLSTHKFIQINW